MTKTKYILILSNLYEMFLKKIIGANNINININNNINNTNGLYTH